MSRKMGKYVFTLYGVNIAKIEKKYKLPANDNSEENDDNIDQYTTKITELNAEQNTPKIFPFLDESKKIHMCSITMIDFESKMNINMLKYCCFWDRHPIDTKNIGCPIKYCPKKVVKKYYSCISKDTYIIKENITSNRAKNIQHTDDKNQQLNISLSDYFITDGVFCSLNCISAWIDDNKHVRRYDQSKSLLVMLCERITGVKNAVIAPAPHWRTLEQYGGFLNIIKFRESFNKVSYECHGTIEILPKFAPLATLYEEKLNF